MGLFDKAKELAGKHADKVEQAVDKVAGIADEKTGGKYADKIDQGAKAAKGFVADAGEDEGEADNRPSGGAAADPPFPPSSPAV